MITIKIFRYNIFSFFKYSNGFWFRIFGVGLSVSHKNERKLFSERMGLRKKITIGNYKYEFLK